MTSAYEAGNEPPILVQHRLRIAREYAGLEQVELAGLTGVSRATIGNAETGRVKPRKITLNAWALACGVPVSWIENGTSARPETSDGMRIIRPPNCPLVSVRGWNTSRPAIRCSSHVALIRFAQQSISEHFDACQQTVIAA